jgi:hypothetical protein
MPPVAIARIAPALDPRPAAFASRNHALRPFAAARLPTPSFQLLIPSLGYLDETHLCLTTAWRSVFMPSSRQ